MSEISKTERRLKADAGETPDLRGVIGEADPSDVDIFGYQIIYTTGEFTIDREDLLAKIEDVGLEEWMAPGRVKPHRAFTRMVNDLKETGEFKMGGHRIRFEFASGGSRFTQHVHAKVYHDPDDDAVNMTEGTWIDHELGVIRYDSDSKGLSFVDRIDEDRAVAALWYDGVKPRARARFDEHQDLHNGKDVNNMVYYLARTWTDSIKLRDSCYFVPAHYDGIEGYIDGFRALYQWLNVEADKPLGAQKTELFAVEIVDSERQREMVEAKVRDELEGEVGDIFDGVVEEVRDGSGVEEIAEEVVSSLDHVEGLAEEHSAILKTELSVKRAVQRVLDDMDEDREEVVERVLDEIGIERAEPAAA